ncbi:hypothetical protein [Commensalibacter papalotli (ex Botero et al. 2024)]|uniref:Cytochrome C oxidase Cbb3 n=1 Tax=Commensalibacter papalotli (ex Botero et al. 2024) TaxID=2972766 RepID=A0ABN8W322_9PROT|nr:hypothetical protein [Commensalibacter papalotli (ex Botero et al. 2024)]CAI3923334.1 unnamed protein product [Commensalibacter papalotli (ex Botero et al. 2024)]CAI3928703.1 unnamed protein product [Commensalibacter papalotli (ex Botero et al. 2024)]
MWLTYFNWFMAILSITIWVGTYIVYDRARFTDWLDNKFGKDDPMPPVPKQQESSLNIGEGTTFNYEKTSKAEPSKE